MDAHYSLIELAIRSACGKIVERPLGDPDNVIPDEGSAFGSTLLGMLERAFPL